MKQIVTNAVVLRRINYQEADRILTFITNDQGKLSAIAKGVRRANSKLAGSIELFGSSQITYLPGRGEMGTLISARLVKNYGNIVKDFQRTQFGYEILKLINKNIEIIGDESIYNLLVSTLEYLDNTQIALELTKFWFGLNFLMIMGHSPNLLVENNEDFDKYIFNTNKMMFIGDDNGVYDQNHIKLFRLAIENNPEKLAKINNIEKYTEKLMSLMQLLLIDNGFNPI